MSLYIHHVLEDSGCVGARQAGTSRGGEVAGLFGKAPVGALAQTLVGVLR